MQCEQCGLSITEANAFCSSCGTPIPRSDPGLSASISVRVISGLLLLAALLVCIFASNRGTWLLALSPGIAGLVISLLQVAPVTRFIERLERGILDRRHRAQLATGKFARLVRRPFYDWIAKIWSLSRKVKNIHFRAGVRVAVSLYAIGAFLCALAIAAYLAVAIVVLVVVIALIIWGFSLYSSGLPRRTSRTEANWFGQRRIVHRDERGRRTGEDVERSDIFGQPYAEHRDATGHKRGESRREVDAFGNERTIRVGADGKKEGSTQVEDDVFKGSKEVRYDDKGNKIGESFRTKGLNDDDVVEHFDAPEDRSANTP